MSEPDPIYSFSIPSIADDIPLKCRVFHPTDLEQRAQDSGGQASSVKGAIIAHPYAPLGGSQDDAVVLTVTATLLDEGFVVGTFNFRGAADSEGHTTWTGKAEQKDYISFTGLMVYYLQRLGLPDDPYKLETIQSVSTGVDTSPMTHRSRPVSLFMGGYSYGSLILARLPPLSSIVEQFETAEKGTASGEIILRARMLAKQTLGSFQPVQSPVSTRGRQLKPNDAATSPTKRIAASPITVGGEETDPASRRRSRDSRRSGDFVRRSIEAPRRIKARVTSASSAAKANSRVETAQVPAHTPSMQRGPIVIPQYLIISPVLLPFSHTLCPPGPPSILPRKSAPGDSHVGDRFHENPTLALFGSSDSFTASRRLKAWAERNVTDSESSFEWAEITGAGHFWSEEGVMLALQKHIADWIPKP